MILEREVARQWNETDIDGMLISNVWDENGDGSYFVRFKAGARFPLHDHNGWEQILMIEGIVKFGEVELHAGDCLLLGKGEQHAALALTDAMFFVAHRGGIEMIH